VSGALAAPRVRSALIAVRDGEPRTIEDQVRLCQIPAPPFGERERAAAYVAAFKAAGLRNVRTDREGNVLGERPGRTARPHVVMAAHLDTVFPAGTDVRVERRGDVLHGPGIGDNCRGLAVLVAVARSLNEAGIETTGTITFAGTVGEEGAGDLRGVRMLVGETLKGRIDRFVGVDGSGDAIFTTGVGSRRYRVTYAGAGGHSYDDFGRPNPAHALGRAMALVADLQVPVSPRSTFSIGRVGGGTSVNAIPGEAWMEVDLRSTDAESLRALDRRFQAAVERAAADENGRWTDVRKVTVRIDSIGDRPAGQTARTAPIVETALAVSRALSIRSDLIEGSTDANLPMSVGIPAITVGAGGRGSGAHALQETFDTTNSWRGTQRILALAVALAEP
jgi:acetylornithine deacetylase/succinyl-diaminopimelate desuccinylase-like protein